MSIGLTASQAGYSSDPDVPTQRPWTVWRVALAVFLGNLMTGLLAAIIIAFVKG